MRSARIVPGRERHDRRRNERRAARVGDERLQHPRAAPRQRLRRERRGPRPPASRRQRAPPGLRSESLRLATCGRCVAEAARMAADVPSFHGMTSPSSTVPSGRKSAAVGDLGKAVGHELLAARPDERLAVSPNHLRANAVPLPLGLPLAGIAERVELVFDRVREKERVWPRRVGVGRFGGEQCAERFAARLPVSAQPMRDRAFVDAARLATARARRAAATRRRGNRR